MNYTFQLLIIDIDSTLELQQLLVDLSISIYNYTINLEINQEKQ